MKKNKYSGNAIVVEQLFDDETVATINRYMKEYVPIIPWAYDGEQFVRLYGHNPTFWVDIHQQLADYASQMFGEPVKPSYVFLSMYKQGGTCPLHIDRPQCKYTIDYLISSTVDEWPICIGPAMSDEEKATVSPHPEGEERQQLIESVDWTCVNLKPNDAVLYSGTDSWHYRPTVLNGEASLVFFHFVPKDFDGPLD